MTTQAEVERVRQIRNACREWMTRDCKHISPVQQEAWWNAESRDLYLFDDVAYALISQRDGEDWISLGVFPEHRGKGLGTRIYKSFDGVFAEIKADNTASRRAAEKAGYILVQDKGDVVVMRG